MSHWPVRFSLALLLLCTGGCNESGRVSSPSPDSPSTGSTYTYNGSSDSGISLVRGWFTLVPGESTSVHGEWHFNTVGDSTGCGPQIGNGALTGSLRSGALDIDLNPLSADNNVLLTGMSADSGYAGAWTWITFAGPSKQGTFVATR